MRSRRFEDPPLELRLQRRRAWQGVAGLLGTGLVGGTFPGGYASAGQWHALDVSGSSPPLAFTMTRASDGKLVTQADYRGQVVLLYLGYTFCPDVCPATLSNVTDVMKQLGSAASHVRMLFVTVDPDRDTLPILAAYAANFAPQIAGLRGTPDQLAALARRYRLVYSVAPVTNDHPYEVTHSSAIYVFDQSGAARLLVPSLDSARFQIAGLTAALKRLVAGRKPLSFFARLLSWM